MFFLKCLPTGLKAKKRVKFGQMVCSASLYCKGNDDRVCECNMMTRAQPKHRLISTDSWSPVGAWTPELHIYACVVLLRTKKINIFSSCLIRARSKNVCLYFNGIIIRSAGALEARTRT